MPQQPPTIKLNKNQLAVANAAAKDQARPVLAAVHVERGRIVAADGYIMVAVEVFTPRGADMLVPRDTFKKAPKPTRNFPDVELHPDGSISHLGSTVDNGLVTGEFPKPDTYLGLHPGKSHRVAFDPAVLKKLLASIGDATVIRLYVKGEGEMVHFEANTEERHHGAIMPMYVNWSDDKPHRMKRRRNGNRPAPRTEPGHSVPNGGESPKS